MAELNWNMAVTLTIEMTYPVEDNQSEADFVEWANSKEGRSDIRKEFAKRLNTYKSRILDQKVEDLYLKES